MAKQEGKGVNIKSMTVLVIIVLVVASAVFSAAYFGNSWWLERELSAPYQPKYNGKIIAAKLLEFNQKNNQFPANAQELLNYLNVKNPVIVSRGGAFRLKNYAYVYRRIDKKMIVLWAIPSPKDALVPPGDMEQYNEVNAARTQMAKESSSYFMIITAKNTRLFQGVLTEELSDIDRLPAEPTTNQLNSIGLFEKRR